MDHINNLKLKYIRILLCYHFGSEKLKGGPKKVELMEAVRYIFRKYWYGIVQRWGDAVSVVTNEGVHEAGEEMRERSRFLVWLEYNGSGDWYRGYAHCYPRWTGAVGGLFNGPPVKLSNFNFLKKIIKNILFYT